MGFISIYVVAVFVLFFIVAVVLLNLAWFHHHCIYVH